jgi:hypothetical protein
MTERKPPEISFASWIDQQINEAAERGAFDNLPGAGKPLPARGDADGQAWLREYLRREGVSAEELLPTPLKLRKEVERLQETVQDLRSEQEVRDVVGGLNRRIIEWRRIPVGPPVFLLLLDEEMMVSRWRDRQSVMPSTSSPAPVRHPARDREIPRRRWWHRLSHRRASAGRVKRMISAGRAIEDPPGPADEFGDRMALCLGAQDTERITLHQRQSGSRGQLPGQRGLAASRAAEHHHTLHGYHCVLSGFFPLRRTRTS